MEKYLLNGNNWKLYYYDSSSGERYSQAELENGAAECISAAVPGNVELDLGRAGLLPEDIYKGMSTRLAEKYETYEFVYMTNFPTPDFKKGERVMLHFEGVDCLAEYTLNSKPIGSSENALIPFEADVTEILKPEGENTLLVRISSALLYSLSRSYTAFQFSEPDRMDRCYLRKPAHSFGWDIFPRLPSAGIWKDVSLNIIPEIRINDIYCRQMGNGGVDIMVSVMAPPEYFMDRKRLSVQIHGCCGDSEFFAEEYYWRRNAKRFGVRPENPKLWMPYGYGEPNLYETEFTLLYDGRVLDRRSMNIGLRSAKLIRGKSLRDENPYFGFEINGVRVMAKGSNWVPLDALHSRDSERYPAAMALAKDVGCNILRVWGGGVYEQEYFYDFCDKNGIMVWQDFMMACFVPPTDGNMKANLEAEFTYAIKALRNHPSLVLWSGDNENDNVMDNAGMNPDRNMITRSMLPEILLRHDPYRDYLQSSPYKDEENFIRLNNGENTLLEDHLWGPRDYFKSSFYRDSKAKFVSETGYHGCPAVSSLKKMLNEDSLWGYVNSEWTLHSSDYNDNGDRILMMAEQTAQLFGKIADNLEEFAESSQYSQAEAYKYFIERMRLARPKRGGIIWWNLLDGWPQISDAVVDYYFEKKLAYYYIRVSQQPFALMVDEYFDHGYTVYAVNDTLNTTAGEYEISDILTGDILSAGTFSVKPNESLALGKIRMYCSEKKMLLLKWTVDGKCSYSHYLCGQPPFSLSFYRSCFEKLKPLIAGEL